MGGVDKAALRVGGQRLLDRVLAAAAPLCQRLVVIGPSRPTTVADVVFTAEEEPGGGPVPAVLAGLAAAGPVRVVLVLAVDLPLLSTDGLALLVRALSPAGTAAAAADDGRRRPNPLLAAYDVATLRRTARRLAGRGAGIPAARLLPPGTVTVDLGHRQTLNVNTPADLAAARDVTRHRA